MSSRISSKSIYGRGGTKRIRDGAKESVPVDFTQSPYTLMMDIFRSVGNKMCQNHLGHLNNFVKILCNIDCATDDFDTEDIMLCLKPALVSDVKEVRAACIRVFRYLVNDAHSISLLTKLHLDSFIIKCLDISHFNEVERIQCLRLIRKILLIARLEKQSNKNKEISIIPKSFALCIISISSDGAIERDRVYRTCLAILCELVVLDPLLVIQNGGLLVMLRAVIECHMYRRINESLCISLGLLLNHPLSRGLLDLKFSFNAIFAPYTDDMYRLHAEVEESQLKEEKEMRFSASKMAVVSVLRSWPGLMHLSQTSAIKSFLSTLLIPNESMKKATLSVLFEMFCLNEPKSTSDFPAALASLGSRQFQENWQLNNMFVVGEGKWFLQSLRKERVDLTNCYMAVLLSIFIEAHLIQRIVHVVLSKDEMTSVTACILLGCLLSLCDKLHSVPQTAEMWMNNVSSSCKECLPDLMKKATSKNTPREEQLRASVAVNRLQEIHIFLKNPPVTHSIYFDELAERIQATEKTDYKLTETLQDLPSFQANSVFINDDSDESLILNVRRSRSLAIVRNFASDQTVTRIKETKVLVDKDFKTWDWESISAFLVEGWSRKLRNPKESYYIGSDDTEYQFIKHITNFYTPYDGSFYKLDRSREGDEDDSSRYYVQAGCHLIRFLSKTTGEGIKILSALLKSIIEYLAKLIKDTDGMKKATSTFLSSCAREYFLFLGALTAWRHGDEILRQNNVFEFLSSLANDDVHENLLKLAISSLSFSSHSSSYYFFKQVLVTANEAARLYSTSYLRVLLRADMPGFINWGINLLITQLYDASRAVAVEALDILDEACSNNVYLNTVVSIRPNLLHLGEKGALLVCRFASHPRGFEYLSANKYILRELDRWWDSANDLYVTRVEELLNISLTCFEKPNKHGGFVRRSGIRKVVHPVHVPSHLYGELSQHQQGCELLERGNIVPKLVEKLQQSLKCHKMFCKDMENHRFDLSSYEKIAQHLIQIKSCLWALSHIGSSKYGLELLKMNNALRILQFLAEQSPVYSIRSTCLYCLSVVSQTVTGTEELKKMGWLSTLNKARSNSVENELEIVSNTKLHSVSSLNDIISLNSSLSKSLNNSSDNNSPNKKLETELSSSPTKHSLQLTKIHPKPNEISPKLPEEQDRICLKCPSGKKIARSSSMETLFCNCCGAKCLSVCSNPIDDSMPAAVFRGRFGQSCPSLTIFSSKDVLDDESDLLGQLFVGENSVEDLQMQDLWRFNKIEDVSAMKYVVEQLSRYQESTVNLISESMGDRTMSKVSDSVKKTIEESMSFIGIAVPREFKHFFEASMSKSGSNAPWMPLTQRIKVNNFLMKKPKYVNETSFGEPRSPASVQSITSAFLNDATLSGSDQTETMHREIIKLVTSLGNSVGNKLTETALLVIKEKFPKAFSSASLFYELSSILSEYNFRLMARRFIQELFHEAPFNEVFEEAKTALNRCEKNNPL